MMKLANAVVVLVMLAPQAASGFAGLNPSTAMESKSSSRRELIESFGVAAAGIVAISASPLPAAAVVSEETPIVTTRMGGLLESYQDGLRGWRIMVPSGWNKFDGEVGAYDTKWQDLVDPMENIKVSSTPVKSTTTSINVIGEDVQEVGLKLASKRDAKLVSAEERQVDGILFYKFDFAVKDGTHQLLQLCVNKGRIWSLDANSKEKRWAKRGELYNNVLGSFMPKLS